MKKNIAIVILFVVLLSCSKEIDITIDINGENLLYESKAFECNQISEVICMYIIPRTGLTDTSVSIDLHYINPKISISPITCRNTTDSVFITIFQGIPELGNEERRYKFEIDLEQSSDFEMIEFINDTGRCKLNLYSFYCGNIPNCDFYNAEYKNIITGEFEFEIH